MNCQTRLLTILYVLSFSAFAMPFSYVKCLHSSEKAQWGSLIQNVAVYGKDKRMLLSVGGPKLKLSKAEMEQIRTTTGYVRCDSADPKNSAIASAALVGDGTHLITTAHTFKDEKTMEWRRPLSNCYFQNQSKPPSRMPLDISEDAPSKLLLGSKFPNDAGDFAVAKLKGKIAGAKPFPVDLSMKPLQQGDKTIVASAAMKDFNVDLKEPIIQECPIRDVLLDQTTVLLSECDTDHGASGSIHLKRNASGQLVIKGMLVGGDDDKKHNTYSYVNGWHTNSVGLDGEFLGDVLALDPSIRTGQGAE